MNGAYAGKLSVIDPDPTEGVPQKSDPFVEENPIGQVLDVTNAANIYNYGPAPAVPTSYGSDAYLGDGIDIPNFTCNTNHTTTTTVTGGETIYPGVYCGGITTAGSGTAFLEPGVYVMVDGPLDNNAIIMQETAPGVTIVLVDTNADAVEDSYMQSTGNGAFNFTAPTTGPFAGFVVWAARSNPESTDSETWKIAGTPDSTLVGAVYTPGAHWSFRGDVNQSASSDASSTNDCFLVISNKIEFKGGTDTTFSASGCGGYAGTPLFTDDVYALVE